MKKMFFRSHKLKPSALPTPPLSLCCQSSFLIIGKQAAAIIALMVQPEQITSGHKERPWRWQPERKGANEIKALCVPLGHVAQIFLQRKNIRKNEGGGGGVWGWGVPLSSSNKWQ